MSPSPFRHLSPRALLAVPPFLLLLALADAALAHETWIMTIQQLEEWAPKPAPEIFTTLDPTTTTIYTVAAAFIGGWVLLNFTGARELFPDLRIRLASFGSYAALSLRIGLAVMFFQAAFGLHPRHGTPYMEAPTLFAPDMELRYLGPGWEWLAAAQAIVGLMLLLGVYVRGAAAATLALCLLSLILFPFEVLAYLGLIAGAAIYLLLQGAGTLYLPLPKIKGTRRIIAWLEDQPRGRAQVILRVLSGLNFIFLGVYYKILHPQYMYFLVTHYDIPTFGFADETFVLLTAIVETVIGIMILTGIMMRALSVIVFGAFIFFSIVFAEGYFGHSFAYGILIAFLTNGAGRWKRPVAHDQPAKIVILGGGFAGVHCAIKLERLLGRYTNVQVTLVHKESYFLFHPLLPEVVGGTVQPGHIANPIRRVCPRTRFLQGRVAAIDPAARKVDVDRDTDEPLVLGYDELVFALDEEPSFGEVPGLLEHALPMHTVGDALFLRQRIIDCLERSETLSDLAERRAALTFAVVGGGLRGAGTVAEMRELINSALISFPRVNKDELRVVVCEREDEILPRFDPKLGETARRRLNALGVEVLTGTAVAAVTATDVVLASGERIPCRTVVGTLAAPPAVAATLPGVLADGTLPVNPFLQLEGVEHVRVVGDCARLPVRYPFSALREFRMGRRAAFNALAPTQGLKPRPWRNRRPWLHVAALGRHASLVHVFGLPLSGLPAWIASRSLCMLTLPGLERNLRILLDWALDVVFRNDIVVLAPQRTQKLSRAHFEPGDEIICQGEKGDCAYVLESGEVEVVQERDGREHKIGTLGPGECFGEIALLSDTTRTATVRCLTPVDVTVLARDQFAALAEGYRDLGNALNTRMQERIERDRRLAEVGG